MISDINELSYDENMRLQAFQKADEYVGIQSHLKTASEINEIALLLIDGKWIVQKLLRTRFRIYGTIELENNKLGVMTEPNVLFENDFRLSGWAVSEVTLKVCSLSKRTHLYSKIKLLFRRIKLIKI